MREGGGGSREGSGRRARDGVSLIHSCHYYCDVVTCVNSHSMGRCDTEWAEVEAVAGGGTEERSEEGWQEECRRRDRGWGTYGRKGAHARRGFVFVISSFIFARGV